MGYKNTLPLSTRINLLFEKYIVEYIAWRTNRFFHETLIIYRKKGFKKSLVKPGVKNKENNGRIDLYREWPGYGKVTT